MTNTERKLPNTPSATLQLLAGRKIIITAGPSHEPIGADHYIARQSTSEPGYMFAAAAVSLGAQTILISGPTNLPLPPGVQVMPVNTATEMLQACEREVPCDVIVFAAEVSRWCLDCPFDEERSKQPDGRLHLILGQNPDIVRMVATSSQKRPTIVVAFTIDTKDAIEKARNKLAESGCDLIAIQDAGLSSSPLVRNRNTVHLVSVDNVETWSRRSNRQIACQLMETLASRLRGAR